MALVIHELATNALKYGALRAAEGCLRVAWRIEDRQGTDWLVLDWRESGVAMPPGAAGRSGCGKRLIEQSLAATLQATTRLGFEQDGVHCLIEMPASRLAGGVRQGAAAV